MDAQETEYLLIDDIYTPVSEEELEQLHPLINDFVDSYERHQHLPIEKWLSEKLQRELPHKTVDEIHEMTQEIVESVRVFESHKASLSETVAAAREAALKLGGPTPESADRSADFVAGKKREVWLAECAKEATSRMSVEQMMTYLQGLDNAVNTANEAFAQTLMTQAGEVSQNPNLNGFIAEQHHVQSFNMAAAARGSECRAKVVEPQGAYAKNSVDIEILDGIGNVIKRYQSKYCRNAEATQKAFEQGNYRGQQSLVPEEQAQYMTRKVTTRLEAPDGTCSQPLTKEQALQMQKEAQSGKWKDKNWNDYQPKDLAEGLAKSSGQAAILGAACSAGAEVVEKVLKGEKIEPKQVAKTALVGGADAGLKAAITGAVKVGAEKGVINAIPKGTPATAIANVVCVAVENAKTLYKYGKGEITDRQAFEQIEETTVSAVGGMVAMGAGAAKGAAIGGACFGPPGAAIGAFVGGTVAYMGGSAAGSAVVKARRAITSHVSRVVPKVMETVRTTSSNIVTKVRDFGEKVLDSIKFW